MPIQQKLTPPVLLFRYFAGWVSLQSDPYKNKIKRVIEFYVRMQGRIQLLIIFIPCISNIYNDQL